MGKKKNQKKAETVPVVTEEAKTEEPVAAPVEEVKPAADAAPQKTAAAAEPEVATAASSDAGGAKKDVEAKAKPEI